MLAVGRSSGILALVAASQGAQRITVVERSPLMYRQTRLLLDANKHRLPSDCDIQLVPCNLYNCRAASDGSKQQMNSDITDRVPPAGASLSQESTTTAMEGTGPVNHHDVDASLSSSEADASESAPYQSLDSQKADAASSSPSTNRVPVTSADEMAFGAQKVTQHPVDDDKRATSISERSETDASNSEVAEWYEIPARADILVTDLLDNGVLGHGIIRAVGHASTHLLRPGAALIPEALTVHATLLDWRVGQVQGFDLNELNTYLWHPQQSSAVWEEAMGNFPFRNVSSPFEALRIDLRGYAAAAAAAAAADSTQQSRGLYEQELSLKVSSRMKMQNFLPIFHQDYRKGSLFLAHDAL